MKKHRNFTGDDLALAESDMKAAWAVYLDKKQAYDSSVAMGHSSYANSHRKPDMDTAKAQYDVAKENYNNILDSISKLNNIDFQATQQSYVSDTLTGTSTTATKKDYTTLIYIGIAIVLAFFVIKH